MNMKKKESFIRYLDGRTSEIKDSIIRLMEDNRRDEADFEKIRANIFQIIRTIVQSSQRITENEDKQVQFVDSRLGEFEETWRGALEKAEAHHDERRVLQEQVKLEALKEIKGTFERIWE